MSLVSINPTDSHWAKHRYILAFGAYGWTKLLVWANSLDDALDECADWCEDHAPGLFADDAVRDEYERLMAEGQPDDMCQEMAEVDTIQAGNASHYFNSWEVNVYAEDPDRATIKALQGEP